MNRVFHISSMSANSTAARVAGSMRMVAGSEEPRLAARLVARTNVAEPSARNARAARTAAVDGSTTA
jgi:hypothetical protein